MKNEALYNKTVGILVDAYLNDTLMHSNCYACAVGNMVAGNCGYTYKAYEIDTWDPNHWRIGWSHENDYVNDEGPNEISGWSRVFSTDYGEQQLNTNRYEGKAKQQIDSTGYTVDQLARIEFAFETAPKGESDDEWMFNGLMAVIDVLDQIHDNTDAECTQAVKNRFVKLQTA